ncbi:MAG: N-acetylmuramoyl-L-alanine amidase [Candidatus Omnitrophica bacterium]|nr:N-acetylmuramoyl-L-alanine amidase [Candidatus Omnitrophota bacterium]
MKRIFKVLLVLAIAFTFSSCARLPVKPTAPGMGLPPEPMQSIPQFPGQVIRQDAIHVVAPGETVWRISKMYNVDIKDIVKANKLNRAKQIKMGHRLRIPNAAPLQSVVSLYPSKKWKYIIIHHSATDVGSALGFHRHHKTRGFDNGLGYHFVIDNGTRGKKTGHIEISPRWTKQQNGAHCKAGKMNYRAIGVCLVGNFSKGRVSKEQMNSLIYLLNRLRKYYKIPKKNILGHGQVQGARTECPGKNFPWNDLWRKL